MARKERRHIADFDAVATVATESVTPESKNPATNNESNPVKTNKKDDVKTIGAVENEVQTKPLNEPKRDTPEKPSSTNIEEEEVDSPVVDSKNETSESSNESIDVIDDILNNSKGKSTRVQRGLYLDADIDKVLNTLFKKGGKGSKSDILNHVLRKEFKSKGLLDKNTK